jgi:hypothetical protein
MKPDVLDQLIALFRDAVQRMMERDARLRAEDRLGVLQAEEPSDALRRLTLGEITSHEYLEIKVEMATNALRDLLSEDDYLYIRALIRDRIESDPMLIALVKRLVCGAATRRVYS